MRKVENQQKHLNIYQVVINIADQKITFSNGNMVWAKELLFGPEWLGQASLRVTLCCETRPSKVPFVTQKQGQPWPPDSLRIESMLYPRRDHDLS